MLTIGDRCLLEDLAESRRLTRDEKRALWLLLNKEPKVPGKNRQRWEALVAGLRGEIADLTKRLEFTTATAQAASSG